MIKKILKIKHVGRFVDFHSTNDDLAFEPVTLIFGYNTHGKSTLTSIFHSLKDGNINKVIGRKTFGSNPNEPQEIEFLYADHSRKAFGNVSWMDSDIEIFDNDFIAKNVYYGDSVDQEQQSGLYEILLSEDVLKIKKEIDDQRLIQEKHEVEKTKIKAKYGANHLGTFEDFLKITTKNPDVDKEITRLRSKKSQQANLAELKRLVSGDFLRGNFQDFVSEFSKTLDTSVETTIQDHINHNWKDPNSSKHFLSEGIDRLCDNNDCVFCGQSLRPVEGFMDSLKKFFSEDYKKLKDSISILGDKFLHVNMEYEFLKFEKLGLDLKDSLDYDLLTTSKAKIDQKILLKQKDLNLETNFITDSDFIDFSNELSKLEDIFLGIEKETGDDPEKILALETDLKALQLNKYRFSEEGKKIIAEHSANEAPLQVAKDTIQVKNDELKTKVDSVFYENYLNINKALTKLHANFQLSTLKPKSDMRATNGHYCHYTLCFDEHHEVKLTNKVRKTDSEPENLPHFKNTLSDSDRRLLAFAFFIARLWKDDNLNKKIVILDDPFSSLDENRKEETIIMLKGLKNSSGLEPLQKIILTHDRSFLCRAFVRLDGPKTLKLHHSSSVGTVLEVCDVENEFMKDSYFKGMEIIKISIDENRDLDEALKYARPCLEHILKRKYYFLLTPTTMQKQSIGEYLSEIGSSCPNKEEILQDNWHEDMHDGHPIMQLNGPGKRQKLVRFLELIQEL